MLSLIFWDLYMEGITTICNSSFYHLLQHDEGRVVFCLFVVFCLLGFFYTTSSSYVAICQLAITSVQAQYATTTLGP